MPAVSTDDGPPPADPPAPAPAPTAAAAAPPAAPAPRARAPLVELALGAAWMLGLAAALQIVAYFVGVSPLAAALAGAVIADVVGGRAGVRWDEPDEQGGPGYRARIARRIAFGAALGALVALIPLILALPLGWARVGLGAPSAALALALVRAGATAVRDEILLTGIPFAAAAHARLDARYALAFSALAHGAAVALAPGAGFAAVALAVALGALSAGLWRVRGGWAAITAVAVARLFAGAGFRGGLLDVTWTSGTLILGPRATGPTAWLAAAVVAALAVAAAPLARAPVRDRNAG